MVASHVAGRARGQRRQRDDQAARRIDLQRRTDADDGRGFRLFDYRRPDEANAHGQELALVDGVREKSFRQGAVGVTVARRDRLAAIAQRSGIDKGLARRECGHAQAHDLKLKLIENATVQLDVDLVERSAQALCEVAGFQHRGRQRHGDVVALSHITHIGRAFEPHIGWCDTARQASATFLFHVEVCGFQKRYVCLQRASPVRAHGIERGRCDEHAEGRCDTRARRDHHGTCADAARQVVCMHRARAAKSDDCAAARAIALFSNIDLGRTRHVFVDQAVNAPGCLIYRHAERVRQPGLDRGDGLVAIQRHAATEEIGRVQVAEYEIGVRHCRLGAALAVADGPWHGRCAFRAHLHRALGADFCDAAATSADLHQVHHGHTHRDAAATLEAVNPVDLKLIDAAHATLAHQAHLGGRAAHIECQHLVVACQACIVCCADHPRRRAGLDDLDRKLPRHFG